MAILPSTQSLAHYRAGKLRPLAIQGSKRFAELPNVPTIVEEGYDLGIEGVWMGIVAPKGTPRPIIDKLAAGFKKMTENKQVIESYAKLGNEFNFLGPDEFAAITGGRITRTTRRWPRYLRSSYRTAMRKGGSMRNRTDIIGSVLLIFIGIGVVIESIRLKVGTPLMPQPGFFPFLGGLLLIGLVHHPSGSGLAGARQVVPAAPGGLRRVAPAGDPGREHERLYGGS